MNAPARKVIEDALKLPPAARAALAGRLLLSIEAEVSPRAEKAWDVEIRKRIREIRSGEVKPVSWSAAHRAIFGRAR